MCGGLKGKFSGFLVNWWKFFIYLWLDNIFVYMEIILLWSLYVPIVYIFDPFLYQNFNGQLNGSTVFLWFFQNYISLIKLKKDLLRFKSIFIHFRLTFNFTSGSHSISLPVLIQFYFRFLFIFTSNLHSFSLPVDTQFHFRFTFVSISGLHRFISILR